MAVDDYAKLKTASSKLRKENAQSRKDIAKRLADCMKKAEALKSQFKDNQSILVTHDKRADTSYAAWETLADKIIPLQTELKKAHKAKNVPRITELDKQIAKLDREAGKEAAKVSKAVKDHELWMVFVDEWASKLEAFRL